jgi:hypothetical protein
MLLLIKMADSSRFDLQPNNWHEVRQNLNLLCVISAILTVRASRRYFQSDVTGLLSTVLSDLVLEAKVFRDIDQSASLFRTYTQKSTYFNLSIHSTGDDEMS